MAEELAHYIFLPFIRRGIAQLIQNDDAANQDGARTGLSISLAINEEPGISKNIQFYGPGDVIGIDNRMIVRTDPTYKAVVSDYEPNFTPMVEFSQADLPWCMTPARPAVQDRLKPWICLIVLKAMDCQQGEDAEDISEFETLSSTQDQPLPAIKVNVMDGELPLPDLNASWAWSHVQVNTKDDNLTSDELVDILANSPHLITSRLVCLRDLEEGVLYHAFIVPAFESGRLAGLGQLTSENTPSLLNPAWDVDNPAEVILPYYFTWEFRTGARGDFEYLVRLLEPRIIDKRVGLRHINCRFPRYQFDNTLNVEDLDDDDPLRYSLGLEGALRSLQTESTNWPISTSDPFQEELQDLLNLPNSYPDSGYPDHHDGPIILPPLYGSWHDARKAATIAVQNSDDVSKRDWFNELNLDPRQRTTAGFGTLVIQDQQEELMASAWEQVGTVLEANQRLRQGQLATEVGEKLYINNFSQMSTDNFLSLTSKLQSRILYTQEIDGTPTTSTVFNLILTRSQIPLSILTPAFRRASRPFGPLVSSQKSDSDEERPGLIQRLNEGDLSPAGPPPQPEDVISVSDISDSLKPDGAWIIELFGSRMRWILLFLISILSIGLVVSLILYRIFTGLGGFEFILPYVALAILILIALLRKILPLYFGTVLSQQMNPEHINADTLRSLELEPRTELQVPAFLLAEGAENPLADLDPAAFLEYAIQAHESFLDWGRVTVIPFAPLDLGAIHSTILNTLNPRDTIYNRTLMQIQFRCGITPTLKPQRIGPIFIDSMYEALRDLSHEYLLPGLEFIPQNTLGLLETNRKFIESYMVGLNAEMARELLWREYPSPLDATYFKQFWDVSEFIPDVTLETEIYQKIDQEQPDLTTHEREVEFDKELKERLRDIDDIHDWYKWDTSQGKWMSSILGQNPQIPEGHIPTTDDPEEERKLVLLVRGDLLKKYPTALIYAVKGEWVEAEPGETAICTYSGKHYRRTPENRFTNPDFIKTPIFKGTLPPEITFLGFDLTEDDARGNTEIIAADSDGNVNIDANNAGWYFVIEERVGETRFGIDEAQPRNEGVDPAIIEEWDDFDWDHTLRSGSGYITDVTFVSDTIDPVWDSNSAERAKILLQKPVRVATHADDMMPKEE